MIFHVSIDADQPAVVASTLARIWACEAWPFPAVGKGSWFVVAGDARNSTIEVYPRGLELTRGGPGQQPQEVMAERPAARVAHHFATATPLTEAEVLAICAEQGWQAQRLSRGGMFDVIEVWIENRLMIEVLTAEMQAQYTSLQVPPPWKAMRAA